MVKTAGSEANILYTAIPQTLSGLVGGITQLFGAMASDPTLGAAFPNLVAAALGGPTTLQALAVEQIFTASPLGGLSVTQLAGLGVPAAFLTGFPSVPEYASVGRRSSFSVRLCGCDKLADVDCAVSGRCRRFHGHDSRGYADYGHDDIGGDVYDLSPSRAALERIPRSHLVDLRSERVSGVSWTRSWPAI